MSDNWQVVSSLETYSTAPYPNAQPFLTGIILEVVMKLPGFLLVCAIVSFGMHLISPDYWLRVFKKQFSVYAILSILF